MSRVRINEVTLSKQVDTMEDWKTNNVGYKTWMFTDHDVENVSLYERWAADCTRIMVTLEIGTKTEKEHLQGRVTFRVPKRYKALCKLCPKVHWEMAKVDCFIYEQKAGSIVKVSVDRRKQGKRSDISMALESIQKGAGRKRMWQDHGSFMVRHGKCYNDAVKNLAGHKTVGETPYKEVRFERPDLETLKKTKVIVLYGKAGMGKTVAVKQWLRGEQYLRVTDIDDLKLFDAEEHKAIVFDDFAPVNMSREQKLTLFEQEDARTVRCRYENAEIPPHTLKIFCLNKIWWDEEDGAFQRRTHWVTEGDLMMVQ